MSRAAKIANSTSIYNHEVTTFPVPEALTLVPRPREMLEMEGAGEMVTREEVWRADKLDPSSALIIPTSDELLDELRSDAFPVYDDDVWIVTYMKTGTTWMSEIVLNLLGQNDEALEKRLRDHIKNNIRLEILLAPGSGTVIPTAERWSYLQQLPRPRLFITHLPVQELPEKIFNTSKVLVTIRNPKDTAVSIFHFSQSLPHMGKYTGTWENFLAAYIRGEAYWGGWLDWHIPIHLRHKNNRNHVHFAFFEDMKEDLGREVSLVSRFLGVPCDDEALERIKVKCSFQDMKRKVGPVFRDISGMDYSISHFFRKGIVGDWRNYFTVAQNEFYDSILSKYMNKVPEIKKKYENII